MFRSKGEEKAWKVLHETNPEDVCSNADVVFDHKTGLYTIFCMGQNFTIAPEEKKITE